MLEKNTLCGFFERQNILRVVILHHHSLRNREWTTKKSKGIAKAKPFPSVKPPQPSVSSATQQATPNSAVGSQPFTSKDISDIRNDYLQKQSKLQPIKPQSPF